MVVRKHFETYEHCGLLDLVLFVPAAGMLACSAC